MPYAETRLTPLRLISVFQVEHDALVGSVTCDFELDVVAKADLKVRLIAS